MADQPIFSEAEVADIIKRASALQEEQATSGYVPGVKADELTRIAAELGIDPHYLELAIKEKRQAAPPKKELVMRVEKVLPVEVDPADFDVILDSIKVAPQQNYKGVVSGGVSQVGRTISGQAQTTFDLPYFKVSSRGGRTKLEVWSSKVQAVALSTLWIIPAMLTPIIGQTFGGLPAVAALAGVLGLGFLSYKGLVKASSAGVVDISKKLEAAILQNGKTSIAPPVVHSSPTRVEEEEPLKVEQGH